MAARIIQVYKNIHPKSTADIYHKGSTTSTTWRFFWGFVLLPGVSCRLLDLYKGNEFVFSTQNIFSIQKKPKEQQILKGGVELNKINTINTGQRRSTNKNLPVKSGVEIPAALLAHLFKENCDLRWNYSSLGVREAQSVRLMERRSTVVVGFWVVFVLGFFRKPRWFHSVSFRWFCFRVFSRKISTNKLGLRFDFLKPDILSEKTVMILKLFRKQTEPRNQIGVSEKRTVESVMQFSKCICPLHVASECSTPIPPKKKWLYVEKWRSCQCGDSFVPINIDFWIPNDN